MNSGCAAKTFRTGIAVVFSFAISMPVWAGGELGAARDHHQEGLAIFGFVKDTSGRTVRDAKVTANIEGLGAVITQTDATGVYKFPGFGRGIKREQVSISCSKEGYKQTRVITRTPPAKTPVVALEMECTLQRLSAR